MTRSQKHLPDVNSPEAVLARRIRRQNKAARGDFVPRDQTPAIKRTGGVYLVRDPQGRPKFDTDPRLLPDWIQDAYKRVMTPEELEEFFDPAADFTPPTRER
jgi:hypothetical protein